MTTMLWQGPYYPGEIMLSTGKVKLYPGQTVNATARDAAGMLEGDSSWWVELGGGGADLSLAAGALGGAGLA